MTVNQDLVVSPIINLDGRDFGNAHPMLSVRNGDSMSSSFGNLLARPPTHVVFADRLAKHLSAYGCTADINDVLEYVSEDFSPADFQFAEHLLSPKAVDWHVLKLGPAAGDLDDRLDSMSVARSCVAALSSALVELDCADLVPDAVKVENGVISFLVDGQIAISVQRVPFEPYNAQARGRVETAFRHIYAYGDKELAVRRLSKIPGLERMVCANPHGSQNRVNGEILVTTPGNLAFSLREGLASRFRVELKQHQVQEVLASCFGAKNWAHLVSRVDEPRCWSVPVRVGLSPAMREAHSRDLVFRTAGEGIWAFARTILEWRGKPLAPPKFHGKNGGVSCPYITVEFEKQAPSDGDIWDLPDMYVSPMVEVLSLPDFDKLAERLLEDMHLLGDRLAEHFGIVNDVSASK